MAFAFGGPEQFDGFKTPLVSLALLLIIGTAAGLSGSDDRGRRYLIGVAAATQSGVFPVWFGIALVLGFHDVVTTAVRLATSLMNIVSIGIAASISYGLAGFKREHIRRFGQCSRGTA
jgi:Kef-type K+ transport system membrane component KefB